MEINETPGGAAMAESVDDPPQPEMLNYKGIKVMPFIIGNETFEKLGAIGTLSNLLVYLTTYFNMTRISATTILNVFNGTTNFATLLGAFLSDTYFGRYKTIAFGSVATFLGLFVITLTAAVKKLHPPHCDDRACTGPSPWQVAVLLSGFGLMVAGAAGVRPCSLPFGADQFNPGTESGKKGINSFFNWYFFTITFAQMVSVTLVVYVQTEVSWTVGLAIPTGFMLVAVVLLFVGTKMYVMVMPEGSPMTSLVQVFVASVRKKRLKVPEHHHNQPRQKSRLTLYDFVPPIASINSNLPYTNQFRFLDKAAIKTAEDQTRPDGAPANPWRLCTMQQVEAAKCVVRVIPVWAATIVYHVAFLQQHQYAVFQALQSDRHLGKKFQIPAASYGIFSMLSLTLFVPVYDRVIVPYLRKLTGREEGITLLQRIGSGIVLVVISSLVSAFVEERRRALALTRPLLHSNRGAVSSMSALWLVPQISLSGLSEAFTGIGQTEFYYKQLPENMRSFAGAFFFCGMAASSYLNSLLISIVHRATDRSATGNWLPEDLNKGKLDYFYFLITALGVLNILYFLLCAKWYRYKGTADKSSTEQMEMKKLEKQVF